MSELLKVERLDVHYGGIQAVRGVSFSLREGEQATLIGANGAGKSSTVRAITGLERFAFAQRLFNPQGAKLHFGPSVFKAARVSALAKIARPLVQPGAKQTLPRHS